MGVGAGREWGGIVIILSALVVSVPFIVFQGHFPVTTTRFGLPQKSLVRLTVCNLLGQEVAMLAEGEQEAGYHDVRFDGSALGSGAYVYRLQAGGFVQSRKLMLLRQ